ncbi:nitroreductase [Dactylosporangium cerinum]|uniref:Nitroreductase n=1 Tax=Dactylosporangium cerinum TaxID=1434730 RepID=A0ABV9VLC2_9ACTN
MSNDALTHPTDALAIGHALTEAATTAGYAPSIHNTQPWRWRITGHLLDLFTDRSRVLAVTDPEARLATLSCGVALHHARMALAAQGWQVTTAVEAEDTWLHTLTPGQVLELASAADHAQRSEADDKSWLEELAYWTGGTRPAGTGIPDAAIPDRATRTTVPSRDFGHDGDLGLNAGHDKAAVYVMLHGRTDEPSDWLRAGEALSAGWLTATEHGVSVLPHSAPIEVVSTRQAMRVILASTGYPYLVLRLGTIDPADAGPPYAPRLPADQIIEQS